MSHQSSRGFSPLASNTPPVDPDRVLNSRYRPEGFTPGAKLPIVYSHTYNISFFGLEKIHPFDPAKWGKVFAILKDAGLLNDNNFHMPHEATEEELLLVHSPSYLKKLKVRPPSNSLHTVRKLTRIELKEILQLFEGLYRVCLDMLYFCKTLVSYMKFSC